MLPERTLNRYIPWVTVLLIACKYTTLVGAYSSGADNSACTSLKPGHDDPGDVGPPPFTITLSKLEYVPGDQIEVTLDRTDGNTFRGFLIQARRADTGANQDEIIGSFTNLPANTRYNCESQCQECSVTHSDNSEKSSLSFTWIAPASPQGDIVFRTTFVESHTPSVYWHDNPSDVVTGPQVTGQPPVTDPDGPTIGVEPLPPIDLTECGNKKGCFRNPADCSSSENCNYLLTWTSRDDEIDFEISALSTSSDTIQWTAVGFSLNDNMGEDSVVDCIYNSDSSNIMIQSSWNTEFKSNEVLDPQIGLVEGTLQGSYVDNVLHCSFTRYTALSDITEEKFYDLSAPYNILLAKGPAVSGFKSKHQETPRISADQIVLQSKDYVNILDGSNKFPLVITHGTLMIFAWMIFASVGVLLPRYFKDSWKDHTFFGKAVWFQIHRPIMSLVLILTCCAFIVIFVEVEGYSSYLQNADAAHPILGIFVTVLVIVNPVMALFRPAPDAPNRKIFNIAHFTVGTTAHILAAVTMFLGTRLSKAGMSHWAQWVVIEFVIFHCIVEIILTIYQYRMKRKQVSPPPSSRDVKSIKVTDSSASLPNLNGMPHSQSGVELLEMAQPSTPSKRSADMFKTVVVLIYAVIVLGCGLSLVVDLAS